MPGIDQQALWHFFIFLSLLVGLVALYSISLRLFPKDVALAVSLLFAAQPLVWGHSFLNAKDIPLLSFFVLSFAVGLNLENFFPKSSWALADWNKVVLKDWKKVRQKTRDGLSRLARNLLILLAVVAVSSLFWSLVLTAAFNWVASQSINSWVGQVFSSFAPKFQELPVAGYVSKTTINLWRAVAVISIIWLIYLVFLAFRTFPSVAAEFVNYLKSILWTDSKRFWKNGSLWVAAILLGLTVAIRIAGPFAGALVLVYLIWKKGPLALSVAIPYVIISMVTTYLLWPYLWPAPVTNFLTSLSIMSNFPWPGRVLFNGELIRPAKLSWEYLPLLLGIQLTIPAILFIIAGLAVGIRKLMTQNGGLIASLLLWFLVPFAYVVLLRPPLYNNFRQFFFIIPPLFIFAGFALAWLRQRIPYKAAFWGILVIALLPGVIGIAGLHPYEYVYYNELVGGLPGAEARFELDYWSSSLTEATRELNKIAPQESFVVAWGSLQIVEHVARPDFRLERLNADNYDPLRDYDYVVVPIRAARGRDFFAGFPEAVVITRYGVALSVINQLNCGCATFDPAAAGSE